MPNVDYTKLFATPDELVDFLMLDVKEQDRILAELFQEGRIGGAVMYCRLEGGIGMNLVERKNVGAPP